MKVCAACCNELPREKFSNKQWNTKQYQRRCIECIDAGQECILLEKLHDEKLFKRPPQEEDCPICFLRMPSLDTGRRYQACCGKNICSGCVYAGLKMKGNVDQLCPFCRTPAPKTDEEIIRRVRKRVEVGDAVAMYSLGCYYDEGFNGLIQNHDKTLELFHRAGELGNAEAYYNIGITYDNGIGVETNEKKAIHYYELAAMGGVVNARYNLGCDEYNAGNKGRSLKHFLIAVEGGDHEPVKMIQQIYMNGDATKDDYTKALQAYQSYLAEI